MSTVEGRNGQDVHEGQDDAEERCHLPEHVPVPHGWEQTADGSETSQRLGTFRSEHVFHVVNIRCQHVPTVLDAGRNTLKEAVFYGGGLVKACQTLDNEAQLQVGSKNHLRGIRAGVIAIDKGNGACLQTVGSGLRGHQHIAATTQLVSELVVGVDGCTIDGENLVALLHANLCGRCAGYDAVHHGRHQRTYKGWVRLDHVQHVDFARQTDAHGLAVADDVHTMSLRDVAIEVGTKLLEFSFLCTYQDIAVLESVAFGLLVELHTQRHVLHGDIAVAPPEQDLGVDEQRQQEVDQHTANHYQQSLPCGFGTEFPRLFGLFHLFRVETLVNHTGYLAVATEGNPADTVFRITLLGFELKQTELPVEENIKLIYSYAEEFGKEEMATLVEEYQDGQGQNQL